MSAPHGLDCSHPVAWFFWFAVGLGMALALIKVASGGNPASLLRVGSNNPLFHQIEEELGPVSSPDWLGHDGQFYYTVARDPLGTKGGPAGIGTMDDNGAAYRYRRILFPLLAGGFGQFGGRLTLFGMIVVAATGVGLATVAVTDLAYQLRLSGVASMTAAANAGALVSAMLLTGDGLALGLALGGVALTLRGRNRIALIAFALAALTKEIYLLVPFSTSLWFLWRQRKLAAAAFLALPIMPLAVWSAIVGASIPGAAAGAGNFGLPLAGSVSAIRIWFRGGLHPSDALLVAFAIAALIAGGIGLVTSRDLLLRWLMAPWIMLGLCTSVLVWARPLNISRNVAILWPLAVLALARALADRPPASRKRP